MKNLFNIAIIATLLLLLVISSTNTCNAAALFYRTLIYNADNQCSSTQPHMDIYIQTTNCTGTSNNCTTLESNPSYYHTSQCTTSVPTTIPSKTFMLAVYEDNTCDAAKTITASIYPMNTCVVSGLLSYKSVGCKTLETYSDDKCTVFIRSVDYSGRNGVCNSGTKFLCNGAAGTTIQKWMGMYMMLVGLLIIGLIF